MITINQLRDDIVDAIVDLLIANQVITDISELQYIINQQTGVIEAGRLDNDQPIVISSNDYQGINENFVRLINNVAVCLALPDNQYEEFDPIVLEWVTEETYERRDTEPHEEHREEDFPLIRFDLASYYTDDGGYCTEYSISAVDTIHNLSQLVGLLSQVTNIDPDQAKEVLDTDIRELIPSKQTRQQEINKFFADYNRLKPPSPPVWNEDIPGLLTDDDKFDYEQWSISYDKEDGYITRLENYTDIDNQSKSLEYLRDDLDRYLRDLDEQNVTELEDDRPQYENKSDGYVKIRNLNQAIIIRKEEGDDIGLVGENPDNPKWLQDGFTLTMWVKFKDRVNGGTLFNFGNPIGGGEGFTLETFVLKKDDYIRPYAADGDSYWNEVTGAPYTWEEYIDYRTEGSENLLDDFNEEVGGTDTPPFPDFHNWFRDNDYERFIRLVVKEDDGTLRDSHIGKSRYRGEYLSRRYPTTVSEDNTQGRLFGVDFTPIKLLNYTRVPIDFNEWFFIVANYNPNINEDGSFTEEIYESFGPNSLTTLRYYPEFWKNNIIPLSIPPTPDDIADNPWNDDDLDGFTDDCNIIEDADADYRWCLLGSYTHSSGMGAKCKVEIISRTDLLRAKGFKV
tara:strand:+ start:192 stop:2057 length:1866 start_codon:yes stop_codon:yes gene_type:complete